MRLLLLVGLLLLGGCANDERAARGELTKGQQLVARDKYVEAIEVFEGIAKRYPDTAAATESMRELKPLKAERFEVIQACVRFTRETGQNLVRRKDLMIKPSLIDGWRGPYVTAPQDHHFGEWIADVGCRE